MHEEQSDLTPFEAANWLWSQLSLHPAPSVLAGDSVARWFLVQSLGRSLWDRAAQQTGITEYTKRRRR
ncbi:MAG: hypothetical protein ACJ8AG_24355 [Ktedonobacteraceae bacterium]